MRTISSHCNLSCPRRAGQAVWRYTLRIPDRHPSARSSARAIDAGAGDIQAVERVTRILQLFDHATSELSAAQAAERLGLNRTTVQRYFSSMLGMGLLERGALPAATGRARCWRSSARSQWVADR